MSRSVAFEGFFRAISYSVALAGLFALFVSGGVGIPMFAGFVLLAIIAWRLEDTKWQISERLGLVIIFIAIPLFVLDWRFKFTGLEATSLLGAGSLSKLILFLLALKLLQKKGDRDWIFIYLIAFFEVLLAAGISISPLYLLSLVIYLLLAICAIIAFEMRKSSREMILKQEQNLGHLDLADEGETVFPLISFKRLSGVSVILLISITLFAVPLFFVLPRVGGAGIGSDLADTTRITGFSDSVELGTIGRLQQNDKMVMRVRIDRNDNPRLDKILWRGVALDTFDNKKWSKSAPRYREPYAKQGNRGFVVDFARRDAPLFTVQTVYLEPVSTSILFSLSRPIVIRGSAEQVFKDSEGSISGFPVSYERTSYTVYSDTSQPSADALRIDEGEYPVSAARYLTLPESMDPRIAELAKNVVESAQAQNRYDKARAVESYLQNGFGYTLEMKAGGQEPLADFLFNVQEGHCEYFATAMAVMLRTQGIATRVVNGFQRGEFNDAAGVYVVKQKNAHSWVEVYYPAENAWIAYDPTPFAGQNAPAGSSTFLGMIQKYAEALETFWIQYFVAYDDQEQRSLFRSFRETISGYRDFGAVWAKAVTAELEAWWQDLRGDKGFQASLYALGVALAYLTGAVLLVLLIWWAAKRIARLAIWGRIFGWFRPSQSARVIEFYARLQDILRERGFEREPHQTPLEFAYATGIDEAILITEKYNGVRFGEKRLSSEEADTIEDSLRMIENEKGR